MECTLDDKTAKRGCFPVAVGLVVEFIARPDREPKYASRVALHASLVTCEALCDGVGVENPLARQSEKKSHSKVLRLRILNEEQIFLSGTIA